MLDGNQCSGDKTGKGEAEGQGRLPDKEPGVGKTEGKVVKDKLEGEAVIELC